MAITDPRALALKASLLADETQTLEMIQVASVQAAFNDTATLGNGKYLPEQDLQVSVATARLTAQTSLVAAIAAL